MLKEEISWSGSPVFARPTLLAGGVTAEIVVLSLDKTVSPNFWVIAVCVQAGRD